MTTLGLISGTKRLFRRLTRHFAPQQCVVYLFDLDSQPLPDVIPGVPVTFSFKADCVVRTLRSSPHQFGIGPRELERFQRRVSEGENCFSAWAGGELAFYGWIQFQYRRPAPLTQIPLSPHHAFIYRCVTREKFRGQKIYPAALVFALRELKARGMRKVFIDHAVENISSRRGIERVAATAIGHYTLFRIWLLRWACFEPHVRAAVSGRVLQLNSRVAEASAYATGPQRSNHTRLHRNSAARGNAW